MINNTYKQVVMLRILVLLMGVITFAYPLHSFALETYFRNQSFQMAESANDPYLRNIQPILDKRCIACHSCREAECRLKLTSPEGVARGASQEIIHGGPFSSVNRTKLFHDATTIEQWRRKGFYSVLAPIKQHSDEDSKLSASIFTAAITNNSNAEYIENSKNLLGTRAQSCGEGLKNLNKVAAMPYRMAPLDYENELIPLLTWAKSKSGPQFPAPSIIKELKRPKNPAIIQKWEDFFNNENPYAKWTSRFLYEHLYLTHFYIDESPGEFYELVRSKTQYPSEIEVLPTVHAWEAPPEKSFYYRLRKIHSSVVYKNHTVYRVNDQSLKTLKQDFWNSNWEGENKKVPFSFENNNPLMAFKHIPAQSRYKWMLENAHMLLDLSARAQNCRSIEAGSPYWDNMIYLFVAPQSDVTAISGEKFYDEAGEHHLLPLLTGGKGHSSKIAAVAASFMGFKKEQVQYGRIKKRFQDELLPQGLLPKDIWNGNGTNKNAIVTALRHGWTASAHQGQMGSTPRAILLFDFALFERYYYLSTTVTEVSDIMFGQASVINYLFNITRESEDQFLSLIPNQYRQRIRQDLVQGYDAKEEYKATFALAYKNNQSKIKIDSKNPYESFISNFLSSHFSPEVLGHRSHLFTSLGSQKDQWLDALRKTSYKSSFSSHMPNVSYLHIKDTQGDHYYTLLPKRYFKSKNELRKLTQRKYERSLRVSSKDNLEVYKGIVANYPEKIYSVSPQSLAQFIAQMQALDSRAKLLQFNQDYGIDQEGPLFWDMVDKINSRFISTNPIFGGILDLHRYGINDIEEPI